jgi:hypothetical protein
VIIAAVPGFADYGGCEKFFAAFQKGLLAVCGKIRILPDSQSGAGKNFLRLFAPLGQGIPMNIEISTKEYRDLLAILHIADVVVSGHGRKDDKRSVRHAALIQKLYAFAQREGFDQLIGYNETLNKYVLTGDFENGTLGRAVIDEFEDHLFWDELISRLSVRDAAQMAGGVDRLNALSDRDRQAVEVPIRQRYVEEFSANGVASLAVIEQFSLGGGATGGGIPVKMSD